MTPRFLSAELTRSAWLRISVILALLSGFALSPRLWLSTRFYPLTPVWSSIKPFPSPGDSIVFFALVALLIATMAAPRRGIWAAVFALLALLCMQDQSRWQPWFYQYALMLLAIALAGPKRETTALNTCCLIVAATYIWSGLSKINPVFLDKTFPWLLEPFLGSVPAAVYQLLNRLAWIAPLIEFMAGLGLLTRRFRSAAIAGLIGMHIFVLIAIGPLGRNLNSVVWPWNLAMCAFLLILYFRRTDAPSLPEIVWGRGFAFQRIALLLLGVMPALGFFDLWDHYLSSELYSGNISSGVVYLSDAAFDRLPDTIEDFVNEEGPNRSSLDILEWSLGEMNVPSYPETRIFKNVGKAICGYAMYDSGVELVVQAKLALFRSNRPSVYHCPELLK